MDMIWLVGGVVLLVLLLGVIGARVGKSRGSSGERRRTEDERGRREMHDAFTEPRWWERGKARDQANYFDLIRRANGQGDATSLHALSRVVDGERKRKEVRRRFFATAVVLGGGAAAALLLASSETKRAVELFGVPVLFVVGGVVCHRLAANWRTLYDRLGRGFIALLARYAVALGQVVLPIVGVVLGVMAAGRWKG